MNLQAALGEVRALASRYKSGTQDSFEATKELLSWLLRITVMNDREQLLYTSLPSSNQRANTRTIGVRDRPLRLNDGRFLRLMLNLSLASTEPSDTQPKLRVYSASYQYQMDSEGERWVFRYDYVRVPKDQHPASHLQIRANLTEDRCLPAGKILDRIHFPTGRTTIEGVIRLLAEQFHVRCNSPPDFWRPLLTESEREFERIAHRPLSGPAA